nr:von Willebrand factor type A domain-containing protein [Bacteroidota bacterium]
MKKLIILILLLQAVSAIAQSTSGSIKGIVLDKSNKEPIPFANVLLFKDTIQITGLSTDFDGNYFFETLDTGTFTIRVNYIGYQPTEIKGIRVMSEKISFLNIELSQGVELKCFERVVHQERLLSRVVPSMAGVVVTRQNISRMPGRNVGKSKTSYSTNFYNEQDNESYENYKPNQFEHVYDAPLSTFSIDVDGASYSNARRFIQQGNLPPVDAIRTEEFINYFSYDYPQPEANRPFSITSETGPCPWNPKNQLLHIGL